LLAAVSLALSSVALGAGKDYQVTGPVLEVTDSMIAVQKGSDKVWVNVQLIDAHDDTHLWAKSYDRDFKDVLGVESEVSQEIAGGVESEPFAQRIPCSVRGRFFNAFTRARGQTVVAKPFAMISMRARSGIRKGRRGFRTGLYARERHGMKEESLSPATFRKGYPPSARLRRNAGPPVRP
jgi:hypothetical protein